SIEIFRWLTYPPPEIQNWSALAMTILIVRRAWGPFQRWQKVLFVACISLIVADNFRISLGDVFGRYWPQTWTHDNPSLIGTGTYVVLSFPMLVSLVAMNYHFVSDVIAGSVLGALIAAYAVHLARLKMTCEHPG